MKEKGLREIAVLFYCDQWCDRTERKIKYNEIKVVPGQKLIGEIKS